MVPPVRARTRTRLLFPPCFGTNSRNRTTLLAGAAAGV